MQNFEETTKMRNKVLILGVFLLPFMMFAVSGCSKGNPTDRESKSEPQGKTIEKHAAEARALIEAKREKAKSDCGTYLAARAGSGRVRYTDEKGPDKKGEITVAGTLETSAEQLSFKCTLKTSDSPIYGLINLELYKLEHSVTKTSR